MFCEMRLASMRLWLVLVLALAVLTPGLHAARMASRHRVCCSPCAATPAACDKADAGSDTAGRGGPARVTPPVATYFSAEETIAFRIQIPAALRIYKALNGTGPKTHEEFMEKIIKENHIQLPVLPPGYRYVYLPDREELMVEHGL
jgi:hypothetical protein